MLSRIAKTKRARAVVFSTAIIVSLLFSYIGSYLALTSVSGWVFFTPYAVKPYEGPPLTRHVDYDWQYSF